MSLWGERWSSSRLLATSTTPSERRQPLQQLGLTENNFLLNGIWTSPWSTAQQTSSPRQLHPFFYEKNAPCWGYLHPQRVDWKLEKICFMRNDAIIFSRDSNMTQPSQEWQFSLQIISNPTQHLIMTELRPASILLAELLLILLRTDEACW